MRHAGNLAWPTLETGPADPHVNVVHINIGAVNRELFLHFPLGERQGLP